MMAKDLLLIPGENKISIINVNKYNLVRIIIDIPAHLGFVVFVC